VTDAEWGRVALPQVQEFIQHWANGVRTHGPTFEAWVRPSTTLQSHAIGCGTAVCYERQNLCSARDVQVRIKHEEDPAFEFLRKPLSAEARFYKR
jgi:hypothetical protein